MLQNSSVCFGCFYNGSKYQNKPKLLVFGFTKQTETNAKQILFRFVSFRTKIYFCLFRGHPTATATVDCANALFQGWVSIFGVPAVITSNRGAQFTSSLLAALCNLLNIHLKVLSSEMGPAKSKLIR
jgi:hypothetical protein